VIWIGPSDNPKTTRQGIAPDEPFGPTKGARDRFCGNPGVGRARSDKGRELEELAGSFPTIVDLFGEPG
jgi:hypothetical protein